MRIVLIRGLSSALPVTIRNLIRTKVFGTRNTSGIAEGYKQANIVILHKSFADDFEKFCHANSGPLPLLYRSKTGEWRCPPLATDADIRTDCPLYNKYEYGEVTGTLSSLMDYTEQLQEMVTFYLGCSFSFEEAVLKAAIPIRNVEQRHNISMFKTQVPCFPSGNFKCNLVVTMRPIPEDKLNAVSQVTHRLQDAHGAPIHIGDPGLLGIGNLSRPDYGDPVQPQPGDVPVFWACGVTGLEAVRSAKTATLAFTHSPGCMFVTDLTSEKTEGKLAVHPSEIPHVFCISKNPLHYSIASAEAIERIRGLERLIGIDPGERGIKHLLLQDELVKAALSLSHAKSVLITTGFPTHYEHNPPEENDGPPGAIAMAAMLQALNKEVAIVTDQRAIALYEKIINDAFQEGILKTRIRLVAYKKAGLNAALMFLCHDGDTHKPRFDHLVAIERAGMAADGNYYNARKINIKHLVDPIDDLFLAAQTIPGITTTGIGDGGNELGMGKVKEAVKKHIKNGSTIACDVAADFAVIAGVSNWGGYAVSCALYILSSCEIHDRYLRKAVGFPRKTEKDDWNAALPSVHKEEKMLEIHVKHKIRSGKTATLGMEVDGLPFYDVHSTMIQQLLEESLRKPSS
ncbi:D-glutamate cyclase, mitochondrial [Protopterus annectens]|uniref:D-glutamate cyclase, mitochondrial n=1 Tax=Protopterus annectens TaxID=7888 RepID=UPI001CFBEAE1|nr:D-glutamate cyclase, mitochondrial [Protopterus annectens]